MRRSFLIVCEGAVTEKEYLGAVRSELRYVPIRIEVIAGEPNTAREIVAKAVEMMDQADREALPYDEVWCVFDGNNEHPHEKDACIRSRDNDIHLALSAPSIELWILLHQAEQNAALSARQALSRCHKLRLMREKHLLNAMEIYTDFYESAATRSRAIRAARTRDGNRGANPSTDFDLLVDAIRRAKSEHATPSQRDVCECIACKLRAHG